MTWPAGVIVSGVSGRLRSPWLALLPAAAQAQPVARDARGGVALPDLPALGAGRHAKSRPSCRAADGWTISGSGRIGPPLDIAARRLEVKYDAQWKPLSLALDATPAIRPTTLRTTVTGESARSEFTTNGTPGEKTDTIAADAMLLPNPFFAPYEAFAARLKSRARPAARCRCTPRRRDWSPPRR